MTIASKKYLEMTARDLAIAAGNLATDIKEAHELHFVLGVLTARVQAQGEAFDAASAMLLEGLMKHEGLTLAQADETLAHRLAEARGLRAVGTVQ